MRVGVVEHCCPKSIGGRGVGVCFSLLVAVEYSTVNMPVPLLNNTDEMYSLFFFKCLQKSGVVWGDVKPGNFVSFIRMAGTHFKAIDFDSSRRDAGVGAATRGPNFLSDAFDCNDR